MSDLSTILGTGNSFTWRGKTITAKNITLGMSADFAQWLFDITLAKIEALRGKIGEEKYNERVNNLLDKQINGEYELSSPFGQMMMGTIPGMAKLAGHILSLSDAEAWDCVVEELDQFKTLLKRISRKSFPEGVEGADEKKV